jgi:Transposase
MEVLHPRCAGLDVHRDSVVAFVRLASGRRVEQHVETFGTTTSELERLSRWLASQAITHVAMEATGIYWKPVWAVLAERFELVLANAKHVKNVPGRKTDVNDAMWLADLLAHGLIPSSFVPPMAVQALRDLTRARKQLMREKVSHVQRIDKTLQAANVKLGSVLSDIMGASGRAILDALAQGETDPERLADQVHTRIRASRAQLVEALRGRVSDHQRLLLRIHLAQADAIDAAIAEIDTEVSDRLEPFRQAALRLTTIPGISSACPGAGRGRRCRHRLRDRRRHDPLPDRRTPDLLGRPVPQERRECRQAPRHQAAQGGTMAQHPARSGRLGGEPQKAQLLSCPLHPTHGATRPAQGDRRRRRRPSSPPSTGCSGAASFMPTSAPIISSA